MKGRNQDSSHPFSYGMFTSLIILFSIAFSGSMYSAGTKFQKESGTLPIKATTGPESTSLSTAVLDDREHLQVEQITLRPDGFDPADITRPEGRFVISVQNRSGLSDVELRFSRLNGSRIPVLQSRRRSLSWADEVNLSAGRYELSVAARPEWTCIITITTR